MNDRNIYDSTRDTLEHKANIEKVMAILIDDLVNRKQNHDNSKLEFTEKNGYDKFIPLLKDAPYGSKEYNDVRKEMMNSCLKHHYEVNRHHPEHFENGIEDFTIVDLLEYFSDTYAASLKSDTPYSDGVKFNSKKHNLPDVLVKIFINTVNEYFGDFNTNR